MASLTGWFAAICVLSAGLLPLGHRLARRKRAALVSTLVRAHVMLGVVVSALAFVHVIAAIPALGEASVVDAGMTALAPAVIAFFGLVAHTGVGLQLRRPELRERPAKRRVHQITATVIVLAVAAHVLALRAA